MITKKNWKQIFLAIALFGVSQTFAQKAPTFSEGEDPKPSHKKWKLVKNMSDEFNGKKIDSKKWATSGGWIGRAPGLFVADSVSVNNGNLEITSDLLPQAITKNGDEFTHSGGYVASNFSKKFGYYECSLKANKTFMSSTFWLINESKNLENCDKRTTELDIQECVGYINNDKEFSQKFDQSMSSNTHSRNIPE
ncbi:glycosyl hydrolase family protein [Aureibaculum algae]|uniref:Glycosyl hydrolase family protein n=1 Tax=Aureibaculum algae TaxID=2584122 RepID=A0A5B7TTZ1_9FLAO|nr:family 16 glycosylhydrolase [Aureibaculum algae]QCX40319.1 glycosyl hydrolase family protein [Aureibaculum algae]